MISSIVTCCICICVVHCLSVYCNVCISNKILLKKKLAEPRLKYKQVGDDYPYPGLKEALKESSKLPVRTELQITTWRELTCIPIVEQALVNKKTQQSGQDS